MNKKLPLRPIADAIDFITRDYDENDFKEEQSKSGGVTILAFDKIRPFTNHPFHLYEGERLEDMVQSIKENGILNPMIVRKIEKDTYEMLAGHNRMNAAKLAGLIEGPVIIKENLSDEEALIYVIETNLMQRSFSDMRISEKATVLALQYDNISNQGKRNDIIIELKMLENTDYTKEDLTCAHDEHKLKSRGKLGVEYGLSGASVARYVRINRLIKALKDRVDNGEIILIVGVILSYLEQEQQNWIEDILSENEFKLDMKKAELLRANSEKKNFDKDMVYHILSGEFNKKPKSKTPQPIKIRHKIYSKYFAPEAKQAEMEEIIDKALELYFSQERLGGEA